MVRAYVGTRKVPTGSGKTLSMMYDIRKEILRNHASMPYSIVSNTHFSLEEKRIFRKPIIYKAEVIKDRLQFFDALATRFNTIFMVDELSVWADQYKWKEVPDVFYTRIKQLRKANIHLLYTSQHFQLVAPRLRAFTDVVVQCSPFPKPSIMSFKPPPSPIWINQKWRHPEYFEESVQQSLVREPKLEREYTYFSRMVFLSELKRTFKTFDTLEITDPDEKIHLL